MNNINGGKATGLDALPARFVKDGSSIIARPLTHIINLSLSTGIIPQDLKAARVTPAVTCKTLLYAGDTALLVSGKNTADLEHALATELKAVKEWLIENKLSLHLGKTESILFGSKRKLAQTSNLHIKCGENDIACKSNVKYLGLPLDQSLTGESIAQNIIRKCNAKLGFLYRQARKFNIDTKRTLVSALVQCHLDYACSAWYSGLSQRYKNRLQTTQNKMIRFILGLPARAHIGYAEFSRVGMLPIQQRVAQLKLNHMFNIIHNEAPTYRMSNITWVHNQHQFNTRSSTTSLSLPRSKTKHFGQTTFSYTAINHWNQLPTDIQLIDTKHSYKKAVRKYLFQQVANNESNIFIS